LSQKIQKVRGRAFFPYQLGILPNAKNLLQAHNTYSSTATHSKSSQSKKGATELQPKFQKQGMELETRTTNAPKTTKENYWLCIFKQASRKQHTVATIIGLDWTYRL
jgi:hypothetical protein